MRRTLRLLPALVAAVVLPGCDQLFPELVGPAPDMTVVEGGGGAPDVLSGSICVLADLRNPTSCSGIGTGRRVTIEETRVSADVGADGKFTISLAGVVDKATVAVVDGASTTGQTTPTVSVLSSNTLTVAKAGGVLLPCVPTGALTNLALQAGAYQDPTRGALIGWLLDARGVPVANAAAASISGGLGPLYDGTTASELDSGVVTGPHGTLAFLDLPPGDTKLTVATSATSTVAGDTFTLPIRGGGITAAALTLPAR